METRAKKRARTTEELPAATRSTGQKIPTPIKEAVSQEKGMLNCFLSQTLIVDYCYIIHVYTVHVHGAGCPLVFFAQFMHAPLIKSVPIYVYRVHTQELSDLYHV